MTETTGGRNTDAGDETTNWTAADVTSGEPPTDAATTGAGHGAGFETPSVSPSVSPAGETERAEGGRDWVGQLQGMIDNLASQATPMLKEIGAKAAELAAAAADKAGPVAHRAAEAAEAAGGRLAERGRGVAADLRGGGGEGPGGGAAVGDLPNAIEPGTAAWDDAGEPAGPAEPRRE